MKTISLDINYEEYSSLDEMDPKDQDLIREAIEAQKGSYATYNQENAAYPSGLCAERTAMFAAGANYPGTAMVSIAIVGGFDHELSEDPCSPCGACRQVMAEYQTLSGKPLSVIMFGTKKTWKFAKVDDILPFIFDSFNEK